MRAFNQRKLRYSRIVDSAGRLLFRLVRGGHAQHRLPLNSLDPGAILVLESHLIGDIVLATPALRSLRERYPSARITLIAGPWARALLQDQQVVDHFEEIRFPWSTYDYSLRNLRAIVRTLRKLHGAQWDLAMEFRGDIRNILFLYLTGAIRRVGFTFTGGEYLLTDAVPDQPGLRHVVEYNGFLVRQLGCSSGDPLPFLSVPSWKRDEVDRWLNSVRVPVGVRRIGIHPGASKPLRRWDPRRFAALADTLCQDGRNCILLFEGPGDAAMVQKIRGLMSSPATIVKRPLEDLPAIMQSCDVLVGLDSGAVHIAAAVGTPTVVLFGPAEPHEVRPLSKRTAVVIKDGYPCRPCDQVHCVQPENTCMDALTVEVVCEQVGRLLDNRAAVAKTPE